MLGGSENLQVKEIKRFNQYIYVYGNFNGTATFGSISHSTAGKNVANIFLAQYDTLGNMNWAKTYVNHQPGSNPPSYYRAMAESMSIDSSGNIYISGLSDPLGIKIGSTILTNIGLSSSLFNFIAKINSSGNVQWAKSFNSSIKYYNPSRYNPTNVAVTKRGVVYLSGSFHFDRPDTATLKYDHTSTGLKGRYSSFIFRVNGQNGALQWSKRIGRVDTSQLNNMRYKGNLAYSKAITTTAFESVIITGYYQDSLTIDSFSVNEGEANSWSLSKEKGAMFILNIDSSGIVQWLKSSETASNSNNQGVEPFDIAIDKQNNIYITGLSIGYFKYDGLFGGNSLKPNFISNDFFIMKVDALGNAYFIKSYGNTSNVVQGSRIVIDLQNNIYTTGIFTRTVDFGVQSLSSNGDKDVFVLKMNSSGNEIWATSAGGGNDDIANGIAVDSNENVYVGGTYKGLSSFGTRTVNSVAGTFDGFLFRLGKCSQFVAPITAQSDTSFCGPGSVPFTTPTGQGYDYQWLKDGSVLPGETFSNYLATNTGHYQVIVNNNGCIDTSRSIQVRIGTAPPVVNLSVPDTVCANDTAFVLNGGTPVGGTYSGSGVINDSIFNPALAGTGNVQITYTADSLGCADSAMANIYVEAAPTPQISGTQQPCAFATGLSYSTAATSGNTYHWTVSGGSIVSGQGSNSISVDWGTAGQGIITLDQSNAAACTATATDTVDIVNPIISASISGADTVCANSIAYGYSVATPSLFYNWTVSGGTIASGQGSSNITINWNSTGQQVISTRLFNSCGNDSVFYDTVMVFSKPTPSISGTNSLCVNSNDITYTANSTGLDYEWKISSGGSIISGQNTNSITVDWGSSAGIKNVKLIETNNNGCKDSSSYAVTVFPTDSSSITADICQGSSYNFGGQSLTSAGVYTDTLSTINGCDSVVTLTLNVLPNAKDSIAATICSNKSYNFYGQSLSTAGVYSDTLIAVNGCDSVVTLTLSVLPTATDSITADICQGDSFPFGGQRLSIAGIYSDTLTAANSCDSVVTLTLNVLPHADSLISADICQGSSYQFGGQSLSTAGTYTDTLTAVNGCDSVVTLTLSVLPIAADSISADICQGDSFPFGNQNLSTAGIYTDTLSAANACDSVVTLTLNVLPHADSLISADICQGSSYQFGGQSLSTAGTYTDTLTAVNGCDSVVTLTLNVLPNVTDSITAAICQGDSFPFGNQNLSTAGTYTDTLSAVNGCDSVIVLTLSVQPQLNDTVVLVQDTLFAIQTGAEYQWLQCDTVNNTYTILPADTNQYYVPMDSNYYAVAIHQGACSDTSDCYQGDISTGIEKLSSLKGKLRIFPNPTKNFINIRGEVDAETVIVEIRSIKGQLINSRTVRLAKGHLQERIDLSAFSKGVYLLHIRSDKAQLNQKVIVN